LAKGSGTWILVAARDSGFIAKRQAGIGQATRLNAWGDSFIHELVWRRL